MKKRILICYSIFIILIPLMLLYMEMVLVPKDYTDLGGEKYWRGKTYTAKENGKIEIGVFGNSDVSSGFIPMEFYDKYGYSAYNCGMYASDLGGLKGVYRNAKRFIKTHHPNLIILDTDCFYSYNDDNFNALDEMRTFNNIVTYHSRWKDLKWRDFYTVPKDAHYYDINKGYILDKRSSGWENSESYMKDPKSKRKKITKYNERQLKRIVKLCKTNNVELFLITIPSPISWNYAKHNNTKALAKKHNLTYIDYNINHESIGLDYTVHFRDGGDHLNLGGAQIMTRVIADYVNTTYGDILTDFRSSPEYSPNLDAALEHYKKVAM